MMIFRQFAYDCQKSYNDNGMKVVSQSAIYFCQCNVSDSYIRVLDKILDRIANYSVVAALVITVT